MPGMEVPIKHASTWVASQFLGAADGEGRAAFEEVLDPRIDQVHADPGQESRRDGEELA